ncbi:hypothetical protein POM88_001443 [Heracleum sosnowskyi]|uniref:Uncharacterized protein n=1 Tax=Heracleum sosnowskyi TaxID=360622 RepID=A0AAD8NBP5_9APIA|nr:hypothetical protein POM88_001443 [Heracleum sosnowskyi]
MTRLCQDICTYWGFVHGVVACHLLEERRGTNESMTVLVIGLSTGVFILLFSAGKNSHLMVAMNMVVDFLRIISPLDWISSTYDRVLPSLFVCNGVRILTRLLEKLSQVNPPHLSRQQLPDAMLQSGMDESPTNVSDMGEKEISSNSKFVGLFV